MNPIFKRTVIASLLCGACSVSAADNRYIIKLKPGLDGNDTPYSLMSNAQREQRAQHNMRQIQNIGGNG